MKDNWNSWKTKLKRKETRAWPTRLQSESLKIFWRKKLDILKSTARQDNNMMMKFNNLGILFKMKEERAWLIKVKLEICKVYWTRKSRKPMTKIEKFKITTKKVTEMIRKLSSLEIKLKSKEEKVKLTRVPLKNLSIFSLKSSESSLIMNKEIQPYKAKFFSLEMKLKGKETKVWLMRPPSESSREFLKIKPDNLMMKETE